MHPMKRMRVEYATSHHEAYQRDSAAERVMKAKKAQEDANLAYLQAMNAMKQARMMQEQINNEYRRVSQETKELIEIEERLLSQASHRKLGKRPVSSRPISPQKHQMLDSRIITPTSSPQLPAPPLFMCQTIQGSSPRTPSPRAPEQSQNPLEMLSDVSSHIAEKQAASSYIGPRNKLGQRHGKGVMKYDNGCRYAGNFVDDKREGFGKCWYPNGCVYSGFWKDGKRDGLGEMSYVGGDLYEGEWKADRRHGCGTYFWSNGRADVCRYYNHETVGEGAQWSPCRRRVYRLIDGVKSGIMSSNEAIKITSKIGLAGTPKKYPVK